MSSEDITMQILAQSSENIQKLFDLSTRIDERVKNIQSNQIFTDQKLKDLLDSHHLSMQKIAVLESKDSRFLDGKIMESEKEIDLLDKTVSVLEKRIITLESSTGQNQDRWNRIMNFAIQLVWVVLAAWLLTKLNLQPPAVP